jgi:glycosyltransferase involved in cell wall biosynthesis
MKTNPKVAIVTDWLTNMGGAERVVLTLHEMYPEAPIFTSTYEPEAMPLFRKADVRTAWFQRLPKVLRKHQLLTLPRQWHFGHMKLKGYDVVISCSGAEAKAVRAPDGVHINYCHSPTQYYWVRPDEYLKKDSVGILSPIYRLGLKLLMPYVKKWDLKAATRPDQYVANSSVVQSRIKKIYRRDSVLVHPPVSTERFVLPKNPKRSGMLIAGRQVHHKRFDLAIRACNELGVDLTVLGDGPDHERLQRLAGPTVKFKTKVSDAQMVEYMQKASGFIFPNEEDFGIVAVEAQAAGCPVVAFKAGGALDTVKENISGVFFEKQTTEALVSAIKDFQRRRFSEDRIRLHAMEFDENVFTGKMRQIIETAEKKD